MLKTYYTITKPGIIYGNAITVIAGFFLASPGGVDWGLLAWTLVGISLVMASGCVANNIIDRDIDALMERTKARALARGEVSVQSAAIYSMVLGVLGALVLALWVNMLALLVALGGLFAYVVLYSLWGKRRTVHGTLIGSMSGAVPPVVGYVAVANMLDLGALILFLMLCFWQMPHSYGIALYRLEDYARAGVPVLPVRKGIRVTKVHTLVYILLFSFAAFSLTVFGYAGYWYARIVLALGALWVAFAVLGFRVGDEKRWARRMYLSSIIILTTLSLVIVAEKLVV